MTTAFWVVAGLNALLYLGSGAMKLVRPRSALRAASMSWTDTVPAPAIKLIGLADQKWTSVDVGRHEGGAEPSILSVPECHGLAEATAPPAMGRDEI